MRRYEKTISKNGYMTKKLFVIFIKYIPLVQMIGNIIIEFVIVQKEDVIVLTDLCIDIMVMILINTKSLTN